MKFKLCDFRFHSNFSHENRLRQDLKSGVVARLDGDDGNFFQSDMRKAIQMNEMKETM